MRFPLIYFFRRNPSPELKGDQLKRLQHNLDGTQLLVIDEKSMVSTECLYQIDDRLKQAKPEHKSEPFGGVSVQLMGDFAQLTPVLAKALFEVIQVFALGYFEQ